jgi:hypothetical protein
MRVNINPLIKFCYTRTVPAAKTESIGLLAFAYSYGEQSRPTLSWQRFLLTIYKVHLDRRVPYRLPGLVKNSPTLTLMTYRSSGQARTATQLNRRAVVFNSRLPAFEMV